MEALGAFPPLSSSSSPPPYLGCKGIVGERVFPLFSYFSWEHILPITHLVSGSESCAVERTFFHSFAFCFLVL